MATFKPYSRYYKCPYFIQHQTLALDNHIRSSVANSNRAANHSKTELRYGSGYQADVLCAGSVSETGIGAIRFVENGLALFKELSG